MQLLVCCILCLWFAVAPARGQNGKAIPLTLEAAIASALENNESLLIASNDLKSAGARVREAWADALPEVDLNGTYTRTFKDQVIFFPDIFGGDPTQQVAVPISSKNAYNLTISVRQPLFQAGKISGGIKAAKLFRQYSDAGHRKTTGEVIFAVKRAFATVLLSGQLVSINQQSLDQQLANLVNTRRLFEQGQVAELDTLRAWVDYTNLQPRLILMENNRRISENQLKVLVGLHLESEVVIRGELAFEPSARSTLAKSQQLAMTRSNDLRQLELQTALLRENVGIVRAEHFPQLSFVGTYQSVAQSNAFDLGSGLQSSMNGAFRLEIPIFKGFRTSAKVQQAKLEHENANYELQMFRDNLSIRVKTIFLKIQETEKRVQVQGNAIKQAERALQMAQQRYSEGVGTQLESADALLALNITKSNYVQAVFDHKIAVADLERVIGR